MIYLWSFRILHIIFHPKTLEICSKPSILHRVQQKCHQYELKLQLTWSETKLSYKMILTNRYRRGLETCPQAKTFKSERSASTLFFRRVRATSMTQRRVENTRVHFWTFSPVSVKVETLFSYKNCICFDELILECCFKKRCVGTPHINMIDQTRRKVVSGRDPYMLL